MRIISEFGTRIDWGAAAENPQMHNSPRVLITGVCRGIGRACAEALAARGTELILSDNDASGLSEVVETLGATGYFCDVTSEAGVASFATEVLAQYASLDMLINAAGGGYERTLGMYRVSRALLPALRQSTRRLILNVPPSAKDADEAVFPYASSRLAFHRLSSALAFETCQASITVLIACPSKRQVMPVVPDPNAGIWIDTCGLGPPSQEDVQMLAWQVASLAARHAPSRLRAG